MMMKRNKGFTLIELLIVVAIIGILAAIAIPNFLEAQTRAKVSRAKSEIRNIAVALEAYYIDNNAYPPPAMDDGDLDGALFGSAGSGVDNCGVGRVGYALTTPVSFLASIPNDPFEDKKVEVGSEWANKYQEGTRFIAGWILTSLGPDLGDDMAETEYVATCNLNLNCFLSHMDSGSGATTGDEGIEYDPTNGTISEGDVYRVGP